MGEGDKNLEMGFICVSLMAKDAKHPLFSNHLHSFLGGLSVQFHNLSVFFYVCFCNSRHRSCQMLKGFSHSESCSSLAWQFPLWYRSFFSFTRSRLSIALFSALLGSASESSYLCLSGDVYSLLVFLEVSNFQVWCWCPWCICSWVLRGRMLNLCLHFLHLHIQGFQHHLLNVLSFLQFLLLLASLSKIRGLYLSEVVSGSPLLTWYRGHAVFSTVALESTLISGLNTDFTILFAQDHSSYSWSFVSPHKFWIPTLVSVKKTVVFRVGWHRICWRRLFGRTAIFTMFILPRPEHGRPFCLPASSSVSLFTLNVCIVEFWSSLLWFISVCMCVCVCMWMCACVCARVCVWNFHFSLFFIDLPKGHWLSINFAPWHFAASMDLLWNNFWWSLQVFLHVELHHLQLGNIWFLLFSVSSSLFSSPTCIPFLSFSRLILLGFQEWCWTGMGKVDMPVSSLTGMIWGFLY